MYAGATRGGRGRRRTLRSVDGMEITTTELGLAARVQGLSKTYGAGETGVRALDDVTVGIRRGEFTAIMGPSGSGKSTLMHIMAGLDAPTSGRAWIGDTEITGLSDLELTILRRRRVGFVFQAFNLVPTLDALGNILLPFDLDGRTPSALERARIDVLNERQAGGETLADLRVRGSVLHGIDVDPALVPATIDEFPAVFVAAACARGETRITGAEELRVKESDRIATMCDGLRRLGVSAIAMADGARILGGRLQGGVVDAHGDHRVAMSFAMAGLRAEQPITILDCANVNTSFPGFSALARQTGLMLREQRDA